MPRLSRPGNCRPGGMEVKERVLARRIFASVGFNFWMRGKIRSGSLSVQPKVLFGAEFDSFFVFCQLAWSEKNMIERIPKSCLLTLDYVEHKTVSNTVINLV